MPTSPDLFASLARAVQTHGLRLLVIGGHAVNAHGYQRTTLDADFLTSISELDRWRAVFECLGYRWIGQTGAFARAEPADPDDLGLPVDLMAVEPDTFERLYASHRPTSFGSTVLPVPEPLHLIALKLHALRNPERRALGRDLTDIVGLIRVCGIDPAGPSFKEIADRYADAPTLRLLRSLLDDAPGG